MKFFTSNRILILLSVAIATLLLVRILAPHLIPSLAEVIGDDVRNALTAPYFSIGGYDITPFRLVLWILLLIALTFGARLSRKVLRTRVLLRTSMDEGQRYAIERVFGYVVFLGGLFIALQTLGVNLSGLALLGGALGVGIGFGLQTIANNFISGLILLAERPIRVGDRVEVGGSTGDVMRIGGRSTWIRGGSNEMIIVPNSEFITGRVKNWTAVDRRSRFAVPVCVAFGCDPERVRDLLVEAVRRHPDVLHDPAPEVTLARFGDRGLEFEVGVWTLRQSRVPGHLVSDLNFFIHRLFKEHGIEIPYQQHDLHVRSIAGPISVTTATSPAGPPEDEHS